MSEETSTRPSIKMSSCDCTWCSALHHEEYARLLKQINYVIDEGDKVFECISFRRKYDFFVNPCYIVCWSASDDRVIKQRYRQSQNRANIHLTTTVKNIKSRQLFSTIDVRAHYDSWIRDIIKRWKKWAHRVAAQRKISAWYREIYYRPGHRGYTKAFDEFRRGLF